MLRLTVKNLTRGLAASSVLVGRSAATDAAAACANVTAIRAKHTLPDLPYPYNALEPVISEQIMRLHHTKHHQAYVNGLNTAEEQLAKAQAAKDVPSIARLQQLIRFNAGGHVNHSIFWKNLISIKEGGGVLPDSALKSAIESQFGSLDNLIETMNAQTAAIQGSGWGWLVLNPDTGNLELITLPNQDTPAMVGKTPLLGIDIWEHAFYLDYENVKAEYLKNIWRVVNWKDVISRYDDAIAQAKAKKQQ
ncbi:Superoxide dismutase [Mn], mitochondrial [Spiromyces aspiralis]|uniref:Superoxide dismutase [Mn], mitochondrial n=1 Tax=Spiromyces aspiralis TaxID=68401 RepID=A0ACC1HK29_9FUNG|nr:Superoxide dismutase [Mn], mitochondrial [Spiromyces aspiralis]